MPPGPTGRLLWVAALLMAGAHAPAAEPRLPRLAGIVIGPQIREAIFVDRQDGRRTFALEEGGEIAGLKILEINPEDVVLSGPSGTAKLTVEQDTAALAWRAQPAPPSPPELTNLREETTKSGASIATLALQRDSCARAGLLPEVAPDAEAKLKRLIAAMANLPARDGVHDAPTRLMGNALSAGLERAKQGFGLAEINGATCLEWNASWRVTAPGYGMP